MHYRRVVLLTLILMCLAAWAFAADSLMSRYNPEQTGYTSEKIKLPLALNWEYSATQIENKAVPVVSGDTVVYACGDRIYALSLATGAMKWKYPSDKGLGGSVKVTPAIYDGLIFIGATNGNVYSLKLDTGVLQWIYQTKGSVRCPPVVADGVVYIGSDDNSLYAVDYQTGTPVWRKPFTAIDDINGGLVVSGGMVVAASMDGNLYGINESSGKLRWSSRLPSAAINTSPMISDNIVIMATGNVVKGLHVRSGQARWTLGFATDVAASPVVKEGDMYVPCIDGKIYAYSLSTREPSVKWAAPADIGQKPADAPIVAKDTIYITGVRGLVVALDAETGVVKWSYTVAGTVKKPVTSNTNTPGGRQGGRNAGLPGGAGGMPPAMGGGGPGMPGGFGGPGGGAFGATSQVAEQPGVEPITIEASPVVANGSLLIVSDDGILRCFSPAALDAETPVFFNLSPAKNARVSASPPLTISAEILDIGSGIDTSSISLGIMEPGTSSFKPLDYEFDKVKSVVSFKYKGSEEGQPVKLLPDGVNTIRLAVKDYFGNMLIKEWTFIADSSLSPPSIIRETSDDQSTQTRTRPARNTGRSRGGNVTPPGDIPPPPPMPGPAPVPGQ